MLCRPALSTGQLLLPKLTFLERTGFLYHHPRAQEPLELELEQHTDSHTVQEGDRVLLLPTSSCGADRLRR